MIICLILGISFSVLGLVHQISVFLSEKEMDEPLILLEKSKQMIQKSKEMVQNAKEMEEKAKDMQREAVRLEKNARIKQEILIRKNLLRQNYKNIHRIKFTGKLERIVSESQISERMIQSCL